MFCELTTQAAGYSVRRVASLKYSVFAKLVESLVCFCGSWIDPCRGQQDPMTIELHRRGAYGVLVRDILPIRALSLPLIINTIQLSIYPT